jgi:hypothetical protein
MRRPESSIGAIKAICFCLFMTLGCLLSLEKPALSHQEGSPVDWSGIREAYIAFVKNPSPCNGEVFVNKLPEMPILDVKEVKEKLKTYFLIISPIDISPFRRIVLDGNRYAVEAVFRLLNISDGAGTEELVILLGEVMRLHPRLYLETLDKYKDMEFFKITGSYGVAMTTEPLGSKEEKVELQARIDALETVKDKEYRALRDARILELQKAIKTEGKRPAPVPLE